MRGRGRRVAVRCWGRPLVTSRCFSSFSSASVIVISMARLAASWSFQYTAVLVCESLRSTSFLSSPTCFSSCLIRLRSRPSRLRRRFRNRGRFRSEQTVRMTESVQKLVGMRKTGAVSMSGRKFRVRIPNEVVTHLASRGYLEDAGFLLEDALITYFLRSLADRQVPIDKPNFPSVVPNPQFCRPGPLFGICLASLWAANSCQVFMCVGARNVRRPAFVLMPVADSIRH